MTVNLRDYWNQCTKYCFVVYTYQCLALVLHLILTLVNKLLEFIILFYPEGLGISIANRVLSGS